MVSVHTQRSLAHVCIDIPCMLPSTASIQLHCVSRYSTAGSARIPDIMLVQVCAQDATFLRRSASCLNSMLAHGCLVDSLFLSRTRNTWQAGCWADILAPLAYFLREVLSRFLQSKYEPAVQELAEAVSSAAEATLTGDLKRLLRYRPLYIHRLESLHSCHCREHSSAAPTSTLLQSSSFPLHLWFHSRRQHAS